MNLQLAGELFIPVQYIEKDEQLQRYLLDYFYFDSDPEFSMHEIIQFMLDESNSNVYYNASDPEGTLFCLSDSILCLYRPAIDFGEFEDVENYCIKRDIPFNRKTFADRMHKEIPTMDFFRPGMERPLEVCIGSAYTPLINPSTIIELINSAPESDSDIEVLLRVSEYIEDISYDSGQLALSNWAEHQI